MRLARRTTIRGLSRVLERLPHRERRKGKCVPNRNGRAQTRPLCFGGRRQSSNHHLGDCKLSQVNERRVSRRTPATGLLTISAVCCRSRGESWGRTPTISGGEHNVTAYSTDLTAPVHGGCDDVDLAYRPCHVPPISLCRPHATARIGRGVRVALVTLFE
jgi:hypothetical protein